MVVDAIKTALHHCLGWTLPTQSPDISPWDFKYLECLFFSSSLSNWAWFYHFHYFLFLVPSFTVNNKKKTCENWVWQKCATKSPVVGNRWEIWIVMRRILPSPRGLITTFSQIKAEPVTPPHSSNSAREKKMNKCSYRSSWERQSAEKCFFITKSNYSLENKTIMWKYTFRLNLPWDFSASTIITEEMRVFKVMTENDDNEKKGFILA